MSLLETDNRSVENIYRERWALDPAEMFTGIRPRVDKLDTRSSAMNYYRIVALRDSSIGDVFTSLRDDGHSFRRDLWHSRSGEHSIRPRLAT